MPEPGDGAREARCRPPRIGSWLLFRAQSRRNRAANPDFRFRPPEFGIEHVVAMVEESAANREHICHCSISNVSSVTSASRSWSPRRQSSNVRSAEAWASRNFHLLRRSEPEEARRAPSRRFRRGVGEGSEEVPGAGTDDRTLRFLEPGMSMPGFFCPEATMQRDRGVVGHGAPPCTT